MARGSLRVSRAKGAAAAKSAPKAQAASKATTLLEKHEEEQACGQGTHRTSKATAESVAKKCLSDNFKGFTEVETDLLIVDGQSFAAAFACHVWALLEW